jgi:hypothetical protein
LHWIDGGKTVPENLILLCRFHHSRIHTGQWTVTKTGPGNAAIEHTGNGARAGDWDLSDDETPTGLYPTEWPKKYQHELSNFSGWYTMETAQAAIKAARESYNGLPTEVRTHLRTAGVPTTNAQIDALVDKYELTEKQRTALVTLKDSASLGLGNIIDLIQGIHDKSNPCPKIKETLL